MEKLAKVTDKLEDKEEGQMFQLAGILADPLTRKIMAKLASSHGPIATNDVPTAGLGDKGAIIVRLNRIESAGVAQSQKVHINNGFCKRYSLNDKGRKYVSKYMQAESQYVKA